MDIFDENILGFWRALQKHGVQYIMVGGYAINLHGYQRFTGDIDIWVKDNPENRKKLREAFITCEMGDYPMIEYMQFVPGWTDFQLGDGIYIDIMIDMKGLEGYSFEECHELASIAEIEDVKVPFLHINHLIENKKAVARPKDKLDILALEEIRKLRDKE